MHHIPHPLQAHCQPGSVLKVAVLEDDMHVADRFDLLLGESRRQRKIEIFQAVRQAAAQ